MDEARPQWLPYKARDGIFETFFKQGGGEEAFNNFVRRAIVWTKGSSGHYCLLDTFLSDTISNSKLEMLFRTATAESPIHLLLVDPQSHFARTRAEAIKGDLSADERATLGLRRLLGAACGALGTNIADLDALEYQEALSRLGELADRVHLELKFYTVMPSGPMFFFKDILLCGRYSTGTTSRDLPWLMIVDDPHRKDDMYDILWEEFELIWKDESLSSVGLAGPVSGKLEHPSYKRRHSYFMSYNWDDRRVADHFEALLSRSDRVVHRDEDRVKAGSSISSELGQVIGKADTLLALWSKRYSESSWCKGELELALSLRDQGKLKRVILVRLDDTELDAIRAHGDLWLSGESREQRAASIGKVLKEE